MLGELKWQFKSIQSFKKVQGKIEKKISVSLGRKNKKDRRRIDTSNSTS